MSVRQCEKNEKGFCIFENSFETCSSEFSVVFGKRMCSAHQIKIFGFIHKQFTLPQEYREKYPYSYRCNRGLGLVAFNPLLDNSSSRVVYKAGDKILPTSEEAVKFFNAYNDDHFQAALDSLSHDSKILLSKLHRNYTLSKQAYKFFSSEFFQVNGDKSANEFAKSFKNEIESILQKVSEIIPLGKLFTEFPLISFRLSKPIEYYYKNLQIFDGKCKASEKPWNANSQFEGNFLSDEYKIQSERVLKFTTFFKYYLITSERFPSSKYKLATTEKDCITDDIFYTLRGLHNYHGTLADDLRRWLRRPLLNQYSNKAKCFFPVIPDVISGRQLSMLTRLGFPVSEKKLAEDPNFYIDTDNTYFSKKGFETTVESSYLKQHSESMFQKLFLAWMKINEVIVKGKVNEADQSIEDDMLIDLEPGAKRPRNEASTSQSK